MDNKNYLKTDKNTPPIPQNKPIPSAKIIRISATVILSFLIIVNLIALANIWLNYAEKIVQQKYPAPIQPVARFTTSIDWKNRTITLDGSMSKTYNDQVKKYIWRIDDGTSLITEDSKLIHKFDYPGYYYVQLSIIDDNEQSDVADCQLLFPPSTELKKILTSEYFGSKAEADTKTYAWVPNETFFNYGKIPAEQQSYAELISPFVSSTCGLSSVSYNQENLQYGIVDNQRLLIKTIASSITPAILLVVFSVILVVGSRVIKKAERKEE